ncbi:MAG: hypothetical protein JO135_01270 [Candidatus Eremiobacteraeota bacterium]|nr:hypothetical protein [Candidatus Eremiobacteraeota bacterium]
MRFSATAERLLVAAVVIVTIAIAAGIVAVTLRARAPRLQNAPDLTKPNDVQRLQLLQGTTLFWLDFLAFNNSSLPVGAKPSVPTIAAGLPVTISGWTVDRRAQQLAGAVYAQVDDQPTVAMNYRMPRPDVAKFFHQPTYALAGFRGTLPTAGLQSGMHSIFLDVVNNARTGYYRVDTHQRVMIRTSHGG